jgi:hypothetical protein
LPGATNINSQIDHNSEPHEINTSLAAEFEDPFGNSLGIIDYTKRPGLSNETGDFLMASS